MHYYKFDIKVWSLSTAHLSLEEEAVYFRLINHYYDTEQPIPLQTQSVIRRLRLGSHSEMVNQILSEYFVKTENGFSHYKCDELLKEYWKTASKNKKNGKKGGRPRKQRSVEITQEKPTGNPLGTQEEPKHNPNYELRIKNKELEIKNYKLNINTSCDDVIDYLNLKAGTKYKHTETNRKLIKPRLDNFTVDDCKTVINKKCAEWLNSDMAKYLRPQTLFQATKFESYLNQIEKYDTRDQEVDNWVNGNDFIDGEVISNDPF